MERKQEKCKETANRPRYRQLTGTSDNGERHKEISNKMARKEHMRYKGTPYLMIRNSVSNNP